MPMVCEVCGVEEEAEGAHAAGSSSPMCRLPEGPAAARMVRSDA
ncbi:hypothetical protein [Paenibacillus validus]